NPRNVTSVVVSPDGRFLASANAGNNFKLGPEDKRLDTGNEDKDKIHLWDVADGKAVHRFGVHRGGVTALAFSPDGRRLASGSQDTTALLWDVASTVRVTQKQSLKLASEELEALWADLATGEGAKAHRAIWRLAA